ncbi:MAG: ribosome hibernation-promoting factor, HPF/YfiA family [Propionibacteriaceae bacterium]
MDVVVKGRHCNVSDRFRSFVEDKITKLEKLDDRVIRVEVQLSEERNKRQQPQSHRVEITLRTKGPVVRAEAAADEKGAAFDLALERLMTQLRKAADRKKVHHGNHRPMSLAEATAELPPEPVAGADDTEADVRTIAGIEVTGDGPMVVREKLHIAAPMSLDQALHEMELVGHDFFLFVDSASGLPSVVYRRKGYDYGVIRLEQTEVAAVVNG